MRGLAQGMSKQRARSLGKASKKESTSKEDLGNKSYCRLKRTFV